jgi:uncharacterized membrane protein YjjB (DUF3815 family)
MDMLTTAQRLATGLGLSTTILPRWGEVTLTTGRLSGGVAVQRADPTDVNMARVVAATAATDGLASGRLSAVDVRSAIRASEGLLPEPTWLFAIAAAAGATSLALIFGAKHPGAIALIAVSAAVGAIVRRSVARCNSNILVQPLVAALIAGLVGGLAVRFDLSSDLRLVAVCPCMVLVPGPHFLNGAIDLVTGRVDLGASRLVYAGLVIGAISLGLLLGLAALGVGLPVDPPGRVVPLAFDVIPAAVAVAAYSVFFSIPKRMIGWPVAIGAIAHAVRWAAITQIGTGVVVGAFIACLIVGVVLTPVARREHLPFAAVGFAAVVALIPGVYLFRAASGLSALSGGAHTTLPLLSGTLSDLLTAIFVIIAMSIGLILPHLVISRVLKVR